MLPRAHLSPDPDIHAGAAIYSPTLLRLYDLLVIGFSNFYLWHCPSEHITAWYSTHLGSSHLDIGVGTGYFLDHATYPVTQPTITLLDLNPNSLHVTGARLQRYHPGAVRANALAPLPFAPASFSSIGLNYVLHCLPGTLHAKGWLVQECSQLLQPGGQLFGATILSDQIDIHPVAKSVMRLYNARGIFHNTSDRLSDLEAVLQAAFPSYEVHMCGHVALFAGRKEE
jgi:ubiquinone/menaquinone biosynthesis C-methylase UbiE